jgi:acid phosphatase
MADNGRGWMLGGAGLAMGLLIGYVIGADSAPKPNPAERELYSDLWVQTSGEYHALCVQTYRYAWDCLQKRLKNPPEGNKPFAVVLDLDETVLDNSRYQGWLYDHATTFNRDTWAVWEQQHTDEAGLVPGAREFINEVERLRDPDVTVFYISNRLAKNQKAAIEVLQHLQLNTKDIDKRLLLRDNGSDKEPRRQRIARDHRILLLIGDNLGDLSSEFAPGDVPKDDFETQVNAVRNRLHKVEQLRERFGHDWIILPNPVYGDWTIPLGNQPARHLRTTNLKLP